MNTEKYFLMEEIKQKDKLIEDLSLAIKNNEDQMSKLNFYRSLQEEQYSDFKDELEKKFFDRSCIVNMDWKFLEAYLNQVDINQEDYKNLIKLYAKQKMDESNTFKKEISKIDINDVSPIVPTNHNQFVIHKHSLNVTMKNNEKILLTRKEHSILHKLSEHINNEVDFRDIFDNEKNFKQTIFLIRKKLSLGKSLRKTPNFRAILYMN